MADFPTRAELFQKAISVAVQRGALRPPGQRLTREAIETPGSDINVITAGASFMADEVASASARRYADLFLDSAEGDDLDRLVNDRFSPTVVRKTATPAVVNLTFTRDAPGLAPGISLDVGTKFRTVDGVEFELTTAVGFPANASAGNVTQIVGPAGVVAQAVQTGLVGNVAAGTITEFVQQPDPSIISVTNDAVAAGGTETESDASLRFRAKDFFRTARRGTIGAIEFGALTVGGVSTATAIELIDPGTGLPSGLVQVVIADANGQANEALASAVRNALLEFRAAGIPVSVLAGVPTFVDIVYNLAFDTGVDTVSAFAQVQQSTVANVNVLRPRQTLQRSLLFEVARGVPGVIVNDDAITTPAGDIVPTGNEVLRTSTGRVTNT